MRVRPGPAMIGFALAALVGGGDPRRSVAAPTPGPQASAVLRVATSGDYAPFSLDDHGARRGLDIEVAARLAADLGMRAEFVAVAWPDLAAATRRGDFDIAMGGVTVRADRALVGRYTRPYATVESIAVVRTADAARLASLDALDDPTVRIAVNAGGHLASVARQWFPRAQLRLVADNRAVGAGLRDGTADAVVTDTAELRTWGQADLHVVGAIRVDHKAYLLPADRDALAARVDAWLAAREADGWLNRERVAWLGPEASRDAAAAGRESVATLIRLRLDLMPAVAAAKRAASLPIEDRAQEARVIERVRGASAHPERTAAVYAQLIDMAKAVERAAPAPDTARALSELRDAIGRTDAALIRALDSSPPSAAAAWQATLRRVLDAPGIDAAPRDRLAATLADRQ